ncbi:MAG: PspA/IM30 family protein [Chloroflexi bacterium]|jgi:phage shock protein A|nr:PspA/IM30 family protein [Chloroflexota bacterium]
MGFWERIKLLFKIRTSAELDQLEDPREVLDYAVHEQEAFLQTVRRGLVDVAAAKQQLAQQVKTADARIPRLEDQARQAVAADREDLARMALNRKQTAVYELEGLELQLAELEDEERKLIAAEQQIADRVASFRIHREATSARYTAAETQVKIGETLGGVSGELGELSLALGRAEEKTRQMIARASALDALMTGGSLGPSVLQGEDMVQRELRQIAATNAVEQELAALKAAEKAQMLPLPAVVEAEADGL